MADNDAFFTPDEVDEQIELLAALGTLPSSEQPSPDARLIEDLRDLQAETSLERSLKRAWERLERNSPSAAPLERGGRLEPLIRPGFQEESPSAMSSPTLLVSGRKKLAARLSFLVAALLLVVVVVGLTAGPILLRHNKTGNGHTNATTQATAATPSAPARLNLYISSDIDSTIQKIDTSTRTVAWTYKWFTQQQGSASWSFGGLLVGDGSVYFAAGSAPGHDTVITSLYALDARTGTLRWRHQKPANSYPTLIDKGVLYVTAADGLHALNASDGSERWHAPLDPDLTRLVLANGVLYGTTFQTTSAGQWSSSLFAINAADGVVLWQYPLPKGKSFTVNAVVNGTLYLSSVEDKYPSTGALTAMSDGKPKISYVYAYSQDGKQLWQSQKFAGFLSDLTIADGAIYFEGDQAYALSAKNGAMLWHYPPGAGTTFSGGPIVAHGTVYLESGPPSSSSSAANFLIALDGQTGKVHWKQKISSPASWMSHCVLANGVLYVVAAGFPASTLEAFNAGDGAPIWHLSLGQGVNVSLIAAP